jgi:hypothetical protein
MPKDFLFNIDKKAVEQVCLIFWPGWNEKKNLYRELDDEQSSQSPFVCVASAVGLSPLSHLLMEMLNEYIYNKNQCLS